MKKYGKILLIVVVIVALPLLYKFVLFDDEPFDNLRAGEIEMVYLTRSSDNKRIEITDISGFADRLEDLELDWRVSQVNDDGSEAVTASVYYRDGSSQIVSVSHDYIQIDDKIFKADYESASEFLQYANFMLAKG